MTKEYKPSEKSRQMLDYALSRVQSVPYKVNSRWVFYQLVQTGFIQKKDIGKWEQLCARARKNFWNGWSPDTLEDTIRQCYFNGESKADLFYVKDTIHEQNFYVQLWFEAQAMAKQFEYYSQEYRVSLVPFRGDVSIPIKWELAKKLEATATKYGKPIKVLYFGDCDKKGEAIYESAVKYIKSWCKAEFDIERIGLTLEQAHEFNIPDNPNKPNTYQWEALDDAQAGKIIIQALEKYLSKPSQTLLKEESAMGDKLKDVLDRILAGDYPVEWSYKRTLRLGGEHYQ